MKAVSLMTMLGLAESFVRSGLVTELASPLHLVKLSKFTKLEQKYNFEVQGTMSFTSSKQRVSGPWTGVRGSAALLCLNVMLAASNAGISSPHIDNAYAVPNHFINYGHYCGPGPSNPFQGEPIDKLDSFCQTHDQGYKTCLTRFSVPEAGTPQAVAIRGLLPLNSFMSLLYPVEFNYCIHDADQHFVAHLHAMKADNQLPKWWDHPEQAPAGTEGVVGYKQACAVGLSNGLCMLSSKEVFSELAIHLFEADLKSDG